MTLNFKVLSIGIDQKTLGRARYRPIDDRVRYWEIFFGGGDKVWEDELRKFSEEKKKKEYCRD